MVPDLEHDVHTLSRMRVDLPATSRLYADSSYTDYGLEDLYKETEGIELMVSRKRNSKRRDESWMAFLKTAIRKQIETAISEITELMPHSIHAVTQKASCLKSGSLFSPINLKPLSDLAGNLNYLIIYLLLSKIMEKK